MVLVHPDFLSYSGVTHYPYFAILLKRKPKPTKNNFLRGLDIWVAEEEGFQAVCGFKSFIRIFMFNGGGGIRTLETLLTPTRFPVVRHKPD